MNNLLIYHGLVGGGDNRSGGSATRTPKDLAKKLAKMQQIADRTGEEFVGENVYYDRFDGLNKQSLAQIDLTSFKITTNSSNIINTNDTVSLAKLKTGQEVTLLKDSFIERVIVDSVEDSFFTINKPVESGKFNGGTVARSMAIIHNGKLILTPSNAPEYDIRYKIIPKEKQPNKIYTWVKYDNPSQCDVYDSIVSKTEGNLTHYEGVQINSDELNEETFKLRINYTTPKVAKTIKLYIGYGKSPTAQEFDQELVITSRNESTFSDISIPSLDESIHYRFICDYEDGTINSSLSQCGTHTIEDVYKYVVRINKDVADSTLAVEYIGKASEVGNWDNVEPFKSIRPVLIDGNGNIVGEVQKNNFSKKIDGSNVSNSSEDTMIEFPRVYWKSVNTQSYIDIIISNKKVEPNMEAYAHFTDGVDKDFLYVGAYRGATSSINSKTCLVSRYRYEASYNSCNVLRDYATNRGARFGLMNWNTMSLIKVLFILRYKTLNSQGICGRGYPSYTSSQDSELVTVGMTTSSNGSLGRKSVKLFGIEDIWGNGYTIVDGLFTKKDNIRIAKDNLKCKQELDNGIDIPIALQEGSYTSGRLEDIQGVGAQLFYPKRITNTSSDKFYSDRFSVNINSGFSMCKTAYYSNDHMGLFGAEYMSPTSANSDTYARLIML